MGDPHLARTFTLQHDQKGCTGEILLKIEKSTDAKSII